MFKEVVCEKPKFEIQEDAYLPSSRRWHSRGREKKRGEKKKKTVKSLSYIDERQREKTQTDARILIHSFQKCIIPILSIKNLQVLKCLQTIYLLSVCQKFSM